VTAPDRRPARGRLRLRPAGPGSGTWPLRRVFTVGSAVAAVVALLAVSFGALAVTRLADARASLLDETGPAVEAGQRLSIALLNQETGVRGYGLIADQAFLTPYREGRAEQDVVVATLSAFAQRTGADQVGVAVDAVTTAATGWQRRFAEPTVAIAAPGLPPPVDPELGRVLFDDVRADLARLDGALRAEQDAARDRLVTAARFLLVAGSTVAAVLLAFLLLVGVGLRRAVIGPLSDLAAQTRAVVSGDVNRQVHGSGPREIAGLGADIEAMRAHIVSELDAQQEANRRLDEQARDLARSNRDLEQFAYVASHDLQEPLRKVSSFCQLLQRRYGGQLDERADQYIEFAVDGAQRMQRLINDLLTFSRVGRSTEEFVPVQLGEVAEAVVAQLDAARAETDGRIEIGDLPEVVGDRALLHQLLVNLVGNACKFHREDLAPVVTVTAEPDGDGWMVTVSDNGIGIEPEYADKVFVIFQRLHGRERYPGTGIGLALAKKIVEFHGGRIWLGDPPAGGGTAVRFTLPATPPSPRSTE
jgi:signal transduction histidine kinase